MASWKLPLGEMKEIVSTIGRRAGLDTELLSKLWHHIERMPEALSTSWINSFGDVTSPDLANARKQVLINEFRRKYHLDDDIATVMADSFLKNTPNAADIYGDVIIRHPKIETDASMVSAASTGLGRNRRMAFLPSQDMRYALPESVIHEGAHYMDKARGAARDVRNGALFKEPRFESIDWLPNESFKLPATSYDVEQSVGDARPETLKRHIVKQFAPIRAMGVRDYQHTDPANIDDFMRTPLRDDYHGFDYFVGTSNGGRQMLVDRVSTEGLAQWLEVLPSYDGLSKLPISKKIIERIEDDPRRGFNIDFNEFMKE